MPKDTLPLVGSSYVRQPDTALATKDQIFTNCSPEVIENKFTRSMTAYITKREGHFFASTTTAGNLARTGATLWMGKADGTNPAVFSFVIGAGTSVEIWNITTNSQIGSDIATSNNCFEITEAVVSGVSNLLAVISDSGTSALEGWFFPEGGSWTQITDGDFPPNVGTPVPLAGAPVQLDGTTYWMTTGGVIYGSDLNSVSSYTATNFIAAQSYPDGGVGLARYKDYVVGFGTRSIEFFYNAGNAVGSLLSPVEGGTITVGALKNSNIPTIKQIGSTVYWIGVDINTGKQGVYRLNGAQAEKVSNEYIDKIVGTSGQIGGIAGVMVIFGMQQIVFYNSSATLTYSWCYCIETGHWWKFAGAAQTKTIAAALSPISTRPAAFAYRDGAGAHALADLSSYLDADVAYTMTLQTALINHGTDRRKFVKSIRLLADTQASGTATLAASDDDYANFVTLGTFDMTSMDKRIQPGGSYKGGRSYRITHSANTAFRAWGLEIEYEVGTS